MIVGVVSDTHGYLDPRLLAAFEGVEAILHAGDVGSAAVLAGLEQLAPVFAVQGNNDVSVGGYGLPVHRDLTLAGLRVHLVHELPQARPLAETRAVVFGHSHKPLIEWRGDVLYLNPGAAGRRGFHALQTAALLRIEDGGAEAELIELGTREAPAHLAAPRARRQTGKLPRTE
jgi:putative phosphoesterase